MQAMRIFNSVDTDHPDLQHFAVSLQRLANVFNIDELQLRVEFLEAQQCARQQVKRCGADMPLRQAWFDGVRARARDGVQKKQVVFISLIIICWFFGLTALEPLGLTMLVP